MIANLLYGVFFLGMGTGMLLALGCAQTMVKAGRRRR